MKSISGNVNGVVRITNLPGHGPPLARGFKGSHTIQSWALNHNI